MKNKIELKTEKYIVDFYDYVKSSEPSDIEEQTYFKKAYVGEATLEDMLGNFKKTPEQNIFAKFEIKDSKILDRFEFIANIRDKINVEEKEMMPRSERYMLHFIYKLNDFDNTLRSDDILIKELWGRYNDISSLFNTDELGIDVFVNNLDSKVEIVLLDDSVDGKLLILLDVLLENKEDLKNYSINKVFSLANGFETILEQAITTIK